jgi:glycosyltransferase involved in cell wall biosynthesis
MISAIAITYNEEQNIERYIESLSFADEIVIVDANSTDKTAELAIQLGVKLITNDFVNFSSQKNFAIQQASHDWVVFFDLDEMISPELALEIKNKVGSNNDVKAYKVKRINYFMGKKITYSGFQNDYVVRLFHKKYCTYDNNQVHETLKVKGSIEKLKNNCDHYTYKNFDTYNEKLSRYSKLQAQTLFEKNVRPNLYHFLVRPLYRFMHQYILRLGFADGKEGLILAYLSGFSVFKRYLFLWVIYRNID